MGELTAIGGDGHRQELCCLNCFTLLTGDYFSQCGQHAHARRTVSAFLHDLNTAVATVYSWPWHPNG